VRSSADTVRAVTDPAVTPHDDDVLCVHFGRSANCSSIGSVVDVLFVSGVVGTAVLASVAVLLGGVGDDAGTANADTAVSNEPAKEGAARDGAAPLARDGDAAP
jgi:hypothetical protein